MTPYVAAATMRADARRNRERILLAARDLFVEQGPGAPLEEVAARAGVGIGTLYRRFPDRRALMRAVVHDLLGRVAEEARLALDEEPDAFRALARYMHRALDLRVSAVIPALLGAVPLDDEPIMRAREASAELMERLIERARVAGTLRPDATFADVGLTLTRLARPLPGPFPRALDDALAHRHLQLAIDGLRAGAHAAEPLPGPALSLEGLRSMAVGRTAPAERRRATND